MADNVLAYSKKGENRAISRRVARGQASGRGTRDRRRNAGGESRNAALSKSVPLRFCEPSGDIIGFGPSGAGLGILRRTGGRSKLKKKRIAHAPIHSGAGSGNHEFAGHFV